MYIGLACTCITINCLSHVINTAPIPWPTIAIYSYDQNASFALCLFFFPHTIYFVGFNPKGYSTFWLYLLGLDSKKYFSFPSFLLLSTQCYNKVMVGSDMQSVVLLPKGGQFARLLPSFIDMIPLALSVAPFLSHFLVTNSIYIGECVLNLILVNLVIRLRIEL